MAPTLVSCPSFGVKNSPDRIACRECAGELGTLTLPLHLAPLLLPTPSGVAKLVAAWDGLSTETQILILAKLDLGSRPAYLNEKIHAKALSSGNAYVRYIVAKKLDLTGDDALIERIEQDPDALVRYFPLETRETFFDFGSDKQKNADWFFALPHEARLAVVRSTDSGGKEIASLISNALDHRLTEGSVSEIELYEILCDYVKSPPFTEYYDQFDVKDIRALWDLVPRLPEDISYLLLDNLPATIFREPAIPDDLPKQLNSRQVNKLLHRSDVGLEKFRKEVFWNTAPQDFLIWTVATSHNFNLTGTEFARILKLPKEDKAKILMHLSSAEDLSPFLYEAISDAFSVSDENAGNNPWIGKDLQKLERNLRRLRGWYGDESPAEVDAAGTELSPDLSELLNLKDLGLYRVAKKAVPWKEGEPAFLPTFELEFLSKFIVPGDTWLTFMAFHKAWKMEKSDGALDYFLVQHVPERPSWLKAPEAALSDGGREGNILENKIELIAKKSESIENRLQFYEEKFAAIVRDIRHIFWFIAFLLAIYYGWNLLVGLF